MLSRLPSYYFESRSTNPKDRVAKLGWLSAHQNHQELLYNGNPNSIPIGDSIVKNIKFYDSVWKKFFGKFGVVNCGIGGDSTQNVLWRSRNLVFPNSIKYVFVHSGTIIC